MCAEKDPGFSDAMKLDRRRPTSASSAWVSTRSRRPGRLMPTPTRIRLEARDENQSPIHLPTQSCSLGTRLHRSNRFSTFVNLILNVIVTASPSRWTSVLQTHAVLTRCINTLY